MFSDDHVSFAFLFCSGCRVVKTEGPQIKGKEKGGGGPNQPLFSFNAPGVSPAALNTPEQYRSWK